VPKTSTAKITGYRRRHRLERSLRDRFPHVHVTARRKIDGAVGMGRLLKARTKLADVSFMKRALPLLMAGVAGSLVLSSTPVESAEEPALAAPAPARAETYAPMQVDETIPNVKGEDSKTKLERLDALSMQTHRQLSIARTQGQSKDVVEKLEKKIDAINEQRVATMRKLHAN
jgi:hypothetical protein